MATKAAVPIAPDQARKAIIDIGSNSVRIVAYQGAPRAPAIIFNEKVMAGLGRSLATTGRIDDDAMQRGLNALERFAALAKAMGIEQLRCVATAAVRDAANGPDFLAATKRFGLSVELLSGDQEAVAAGQGVICGIPDADGIAADLGGGSLELVRVRDGRVHERTSFQLGVLRLAGVRLLDKSYEKGREAVVRHVRKTLRTAEWLDDARDLPLYLVGGSWRSLARVEMDADDDPLPVMHMHRMDPRAAARIARLVDKMSLDDLEDVPGISGARVPTLHDAAALLETLVKELKSSALVVSSTGLREGLLYQRMTPAVRRQDPLIAAAAEAGARLSRFPQHGTLLSQWLEPLFADESAEDRRLRLAACLLSDVAWNANPGFRAERGLEVALHGEWLAIDVPGRVMMGQALFTCFGGGARPFPGYPASLDPAIATRAINWGLAMRLGQRLSAGLSEPLRQTRIERRGDTIALVLPGAAAAYAGEAVTRRLRALAQALGCDYCVETDD